MYLSHSYASKLTQESSRCGRFWHHSGSFGRLGEGESAKSALAPDCRHHVRRFARTPSPPPPPPAAVALRSSASARRSPCRAARPPAHIRSRQPYTARNAARSERVSQSDLLGDREANENEERIQGRRTRTDGRCEWGRTV